MSEEVDAPVAPAAPAAPAEGEATPAQNTADTAAAPKGDAKAPTTPDLAEKRGQSRFDRKIGRLHKDAAEAKARADFFEKKYNEAQKPAAPVDGAPTLAQFDYDPEKYAAAKAEYTKDQALKERDTKQRTESYQRERQNLLAGWEEKVDRADEKYEDFNEVVGQLQPGTPFVDAIMEAENAEDVAYFLGKNPKEAARIIQLHPRAQIREIGKLEAKLLAEPVKPKTPSKAPAPIAPLSGAASTGSKDIWDKETDMKTFMKARSKQVHGR